MKKKGYIMFLFGKKRGINSGIKEYKETKGALLIDVREVDEYRSGHIPGALNVPLSTIKTGITKIAPDKEKKLFVYCLSGARSRNATDILKSMGYVRVKNIGGINSYKGNIEK